MKKKAIAKIIVCSIFAVLFTGFLITALLLPTRAYQCSVGSVDVDLSGETFFQNIGKAFTEFVNDSVRFPSPFRISVGENYDAKGYASGNATYAEIPETLDIDWAAGRIVILSDASATEIRLTEWKGNVDPETASESVADEAYRMRHIVENGKLKIREYSGTLNAAGTFSKTLLVVLPQKTFGTLSLDIASADLELNQVNARELDVDAASGSIKATDCVFDKTDCDFAAPKGEFVRCSIKTVDVDCASCDFSFDLLNTPEKMNFDFASGAFRIVLPSDASFTAQSDSVAGKVTVNGFASISKIGDKMVVGSGASSFQFDMMAGSISITARVSN